MNIILEGIVGSRAYGLNTPQSDTDLRGIFVSPTQEILGLNKPKDIIDQNEPDITYYEIEKFLTLALQANPNILEILWLTDYTQFTNWGLELIMLRDCFLSNRIMNTYGGYAKSQADRLEKRETDFASNLKKRYSKHARHCFRLMQQGEQLLTTAKLTVQVPNRTELFEIGQLEPVELIKRFNERFEQFNQVVSILPAEPDFERINEFLLQIRAYYFAK